MKKPVLLVASAILVAAAGTVLAAEEAAKKMETPKPGPEHKKLEYFVGEWAVEGASAPSPFGPGGKFTSKDSCKWFEGGYSVVCHSSGTNPKGPTKGIGILGYSTEEKAYTYYGLDNSPMTMMSVPRGVIAGDTWTYTGEDKIEGKTIRSRYMIKVLSPSAYTFKWEMQGDAGPTTIVEGKATRAKG